MLKGLFNRRSPNAVFERSAQELQLKTQAHVDAWGLGNAERWDADLEAGTITFTNADGWIITAPVQVVGTYNLKDGTWLWSWDHPSIAEHLAQDARLTRAFGETYRLKQYTTRKVECTEEDAWRFAAVTCHLGDAQGAYRGPSGTTLVFMTFGSVSVNKP